MTTSPWISRLLLHRNEYLASFSATLCIFMVLCTNAWSSPALPKLLNVPNPPLSITSGDGSWIVSIQAIGGIFGMILVGLTVDRFGRKWPFIASALPVIAGWIMIALARTALLLYIARFLFGISYGMAYGIISIYIGEITSDEVRGAAASLITVLAKLAILFEYSVGPYVSFETLAWLSMVGPVLFLLTFVWMPESPHYLLGRGRSLKWLRRTSAVEEELNCTRKSIERTASERGSMRELFLPAYRNNIIIVLILAVGMQMSGVQAVLSYAQTIFSQISSDLTDAQMSIVLGVVQMVTVSFPVFLVDRVGRRPLLLWSGAGSCIGLLLVSIYFTLEAAGVNVESFGWVSFVGLLFFVISYAFGMATVPFAIMSEIFPKNIRAHANALFGILSGVAIFAVLKLFQIALDNVGAYLPFWVFTVSIGLTFGFVFLYIPETKGKSLDEVQEIIAGWRRKRVPSKSVIVGD
ncbi:facilitated trehalose transporter Tret1-like [Anopheles merus]|uniref:facilitated trehalose transporter Tret1-like n=1 Tax=Anopheles merus TaxID=30066 RepID=UPI001BE42DC8|nr:facilitated trehalose transporter Tret1-like [Anopheles merus]